MKKFYDSLREHAKNIFDFEKKMLPLTKEELISYQHAEVCYICGGKILLLKRYVIERLNVIVITKVNVLVIWDIVFVI